MVARRYEISLLVLGNICLALTNEKLLKTRREISYLLAARYCSVCYLNTKINLIHFFCSRGVYPVGY